MNILFENAKIIGRGGVFLAVTGAFISYIGPDRPAGRFDRIVDCRGGLLLPGLYNCHTHAAMTLFRGYGEDMPLQRWLEERIFPAEERLTPGSVYISSLFAIAEMIKNGIVSFTDMYMFCGETARAAAETGIKANLSRPVVSFDPGEDMTRSVRFLESKQLFENYNNASDGRIKIDMSLHAEYTNTASSSRFMADYAAKVGANMHVHLSETEFEHNGCKARHGVTPARFFADNGVFGVPTTAAHCVWAEDDDIDIMRRYGVTAAHNPASNLKLGSGVIPFTKMVRNGVAVTLGTDGAASNNTLDIMKEMYLAAILHKGVEHDPANVTAQTIITAATENGARSQGRFDSGRLENGQRADIILIDLDTLNNIPYYDLSYAAVYSANSSNVALTMADGKILYENGCFTTIDIEKLKREMRDTCAGYFKEK